MQNLGKSLHVDIGFLFKKPATFEKGISTLSRTEPELVSTCDKQVWSEPLVKVRNDLEHESGIFSRISTIPEAPALQQASQPSETYRDAIRCTLFDRWRAL